MYLVQIRCNGLEVKSVYRKTIIQNAGFDKFLSMAKNENWSYFIYNSYPQLSCSPPWLALPVTISAEWYLESVLLLWYKLIPFRFRISVKTYSYIFFFVKCNPLTILILIELKRTSTNLLLTLPAVLLLKNGLWSIEIPQVNVFSLRSSIKIRLIYILFEKLLLC